MFFSSVFWDDIALMVVISCTATAAMLTSVCRRAVSTGGGRRLLSGMAELQSRLQALLPAEWERVRAARKEHGERVAGNVSVAQVLGGMRGIPSLVSDLSELKSDEGIHYRGKPLQQLRSELSSKGTEPKSEAVLWLLLTGEVPSQAQERSLVEELRSREEKAMQATSRPELDVVQRMASEGSHPMSQLSAAILCMQRNSAFARAYNEGVHKQKLWEYALQDGIDLLASLPEVASHVYRCTYGAGGMPRDSESRAVDWAARFARGLGLSSDAAMDYMRLYAFLHCEHQLGNASTHAGYLISSTLADPYFATSAAVNALAGPLHGLANQEVLSFMDGIPRDSSIREHAERTMAEGRVIPGYGHGALRCEDPRFTIQRDFAKANASVWNNERVQLAEGMYQQVPPFLRSTGKVANPQPNTDAMSGAILSSLGLEQRTYYTAVFAAARSIGVVAQVVQARKLALPIERPRSVTLDELLAESRQHSN